MIGIPTKPELEKMTANCPTRSALPQARYAMAAETTSARVKKSPIHRALTSCSASNSIAKAWMITAGVAT